MSARRKYRRSCASERTPFSQAARIWIGLALRAPRLGTLHPAADRPIPLAGCG
jgi:hypothetical protein